MAVLSTTYHVPLGTPLPDFTLPCTDDHPITLSDLSADGPLLVVFAANHCPYVKHIELKLAEVIGEFADSDLQVVAISSNRTDEYADDGPEGMNDQAKRAGWNFPYLIDEDQQAALAFHAACTPDFFLYNRGGQLAYRGAFDASTPKNDQPLTGDLLRNAIELTLNYEPVPEPHRPAMGCGIKWYPDNDPN